VAGVLVVTSSMALRVRLGVPGMRRLRRRLFIRAGWGGMRVVMVLVHGFPSAIIHAFMTGAPTARLARRRFAEGLHVFNVWRTLAETGTDQVAGAGGS
jgi:hypothetical protein